MWLYVKSHSAVIRLYRIVKGTIQAANAGLARMDALAGVLTSRPARGNGIAHRPLTSDPLRGGDDPHYREMALAFSERMQRLLRKVEQFGATPVCVTQPVRYYKLDRDRHIMGTSETFRPPDGPMNGVDYFYRKRAHDEELRRRCREFGAPIVDLEPFEWDDSDFYDYVHMTPQGTRKVGERLAQALTPILNDR